MRNAFASEITEIATENEKVVLLSADIGNRLFDRYKEVAPDRFFNCGIAEANMISTAAGLAMSGLRPVAYTIAPFITSRCYEQIKLDVCYHNVPVILVGTGAGLSYASLGPTHHSIEDIAILRALPNMTVICPGDSFELRAALRAALKQNGPVYIRIGKKGEPLIHADVPQLTIGKALPIRDGSDICILSTGNTLSLAIECANKLADQSFSAQVTSFHTVKPLDNAFLEETFARYPLVATIEEHSILGGFGSSIAEWRARHVDSGGRLITFGIADEFIHESLNQAQARQHFGLTSEQIVPQILNSITRKTMVLR
jgi:transketolase